jgi:beta-N-acetylhexosaminidase
MVKRFVFITMMIFALLSSCAKKPPDIIQLEDKQPEITQTEVVQQEVTQTNIITAEVTRSEKESIFIEKLIAGMDIESRIAQLFILSFNESDVKPSRELERFIKETKVGGYVLFKSNITTVEGTKSMTDAAKAVCVTPPFICIDEEGGLVSRLSVLPGFTAQPAAQIIGATANTQNAYITGETIGRSLASIGVNVDFAPVADVLTNPQNRVIGSRSYSSDPVIVSDMVSAFQAGLHSQGIMSAPKHFPGHGNTANDSHINLAIINSSLNDLSANEYKPFIRAIGEGAQFIMVGHLLAPGIEPQGLPATLSGYFIKGVLRGELKFGGIVVTDAMNMGAITVNYSPAQAAVMAFTAGVDMILMPENFHSAADGILQAVRNGAISNERIHESLTRILKTKIAAGLISIPD